MSGAGSGPELFYFSVDNFLDFPNRSKFKIHLLSAIGDLIESIAHF